MSPLNGPSPVDEYIQNGGVQPYHVCYVVENMMEALEALHNENFMPLFWPVASVAMHDKQICYLYNKSVGLIEIVEK